MTLVVDANVAIKWYVSEPGSEAAQTLLEGQDLLLAPAHALAEIGHVLIRRLRDAAISRQQVNAAMNGLRKTLTLVPLDELVDEAMQIASTTSTSFYDALYVSAAVRWNAPLLTADERLIRSLQGTAWSSTIGALGALTSRQGSP